jgi:hypothetical protein
MNYAYYQGQEQPALDYFKKLLESENDAKAREALSTLIAQLEKAIKEKTEEAALKRESAPQNLSVA